MLLVYEVHIHIPAEEVVGVLGVKLTRRLDYIDHPICAMYTLLPSS